MRRMNLYTTLSKLSIALLAFFSPIALCIHVITFLVVVDLITGILKSFKLNKDVKGFWNKIKIIKSHKLRRSFLKWFVYVIFIMCVYAFEKALGIEIYLYLAQISFAMLSMIELYSIGENIDIVTGKRGVFVSIVNKIRRVFENKVENIINNENK